MGVGGGCTLWWELTDVPLFSWFMVVLDSRDVSGGVIY
jgi:hypothetical protein